MKIPVLVPTRALTGALCCLLTCGVPFQPASASSAKSSTTQRTVRVELTVRVTKKAPGSIAGTATFVGSTASGSQLAGSGTVALRGKVLKGGIHLDGTGSIRFNATATRGDRTTSRIGTTRATLSFAGRDLQPGSSFVIDDATLTFLGGSTEGTGI